MIQRFEIHNSNCEEPFGVKVDSKLWFEDHSTDLLKSYIPFLE